jgi:hypothetical protein
MRVLVSTDSDAQLCRIAREGNFLAQREVARVYVYLKYLQEKSTDFWNVGGSASGVLESVVTRTNGTPIWRLYPTHATCIALLTVQNGDLLVLAICNRAEVEAVEQSLINY